MITSTQDSLFKKVWDISPDAMIIFDKDGVVLEVNKQFTTMYGYSKAETIGQDFTTAMPCDDKSRAKEKFRTMISGKEPAEPFECEITKKTNAKIWVKVRVEFLYEGNRKTAVLSVIKDITEERKSRKLLLENQKRFEAIAGHIPGAVFQFKSDSNGSYSVPFMSNSAEKLFEKSIADVTDPAQMFSDIHPDDYQNFLKSIEASKEQLSNWNHVFRLVTNGKTKWIKGSSKPQVLADGSVLWNGVLLDISEQKKAELALKESEDKFRSLFSASPDAILLAETATGIIVDANEAAGELFDMPATSIIGKHQKDLHPVEQAQRADNAFRNRPVSPDSGAPSVEIGISAGNNQTKTVEIRGRVINIGNKEYVLGDFRDVTDKRGIEKELIESEARYKALFYDNKSVMLLINPDEGFIVDANDTAVRFYGYPKKTLLQLNISDINTLPTEQVNREMQKAALDKRDFFEFQHRLSTGEIRDVQVYSGNIFWQEKQLLYSIVHDVTEKKQAEKSNRKNNERLESLLRLAQQNFHTNQELLDYALHEAIDLTESEFGYIYYYDENKRQFTLNTWSKGVMDACNVLNPPNVYDLDNTGCWGEAVRQRKPILINDYSYDNQYVKGTPEGHVKIDKFLTIPIFADNQIVAVLGVINKRVDYDNDDVRQLTLLMDNVWKMVEKQNVQQQLLEAKEKAEESDRLKTAFLNNISHEYRTPMNAIAGFSNLLANTNVSQDKQKVFAGRIKESCNRLLDLVTDTVEISEIQSKNLHLYMTGVNVYELIKNVVTGLKSKVERKGLKLHIDVACKQENLVIQTDEHKLIRSLKHILENALKFTNSGYIKISCATYESDQVLISVEDTGIGIPEDIQPKIFEPFWQADTEMIHAFGGNGIGLAITKSYIEALGGKIWLESEPDKGTTITFSLPVGSSENIYIPRDNIYSHTVRSLQGKTILIVEDEETNYLFLEELLSGSKASILHARNGREAVELFRKITKIDLVLMDIKMPVMNGKDAMRRIKQLMPHVPVIAQTAYTHENDVKKLREKGFDDYIAKPIREDSLMEKIRKHISGKKKE